MTSAIGRTIRVSAAAWPVAAAVGRALMAGSTATVNSTTPTCTRTTSSHSGMARGMLRITPRIVSPMPAGSPRHRRSAATTLASAEIPTAVATITLTTNSAHGSGVSGAAAKRFCTCDSTVGVISIWSRLATAAGTARTRNSDHSRPKVSKVRPSTDATSIRGPATTFAGSTQPW